MFQAVLPRLLSLLRLDRQIGVPERSLTSRHPLQFEHVDLPLSLLQLVLHHNVQAIVSEADQRSVRDDLCEVERAEYSHGNARFVGRDQCFRGIGRSLPF